jgi:hypothetical protein
MDYKKAVRIAVECIQAENQRLAVSANLHDIYQVENPTAVNASRRRKELREAVEILKQNPKLNI